MRVFKSLAICLILLVAYGSSRFSRFVVEAHSSRALFMGQRHGITAATRITAYYPTLFSRVQVLDTQMVNAYSFNVQWATGSDSMHPHITYCLWRMPLK